MIRHYGAIGAASIWVMLNLGTVLFSLPIIHAKFLRGEFRHWLLADFAWPSLAVLVVVGMGYLFMPVSMGMAGQAAWIMASVLGGLLSGGLLTPVTRSFFLRKTAA